MGKKYIIDLNPDCVEGEYLRIPARIAGEEQWLVTKAALTPYTEPDLEQVRKEGYKEGREAGIKDGKCEAWEAARKIIHMPEGDLLNIFTECYSAVCTALQVILKYNASEAIEKLKTYEQEQEEIKVGDEVIPRETEYDTMIVTRLWKDDYDSNCIDAIGFDGRISSFLVSRVSKTGKHYEIAEVLAKMRGEQDG